MRPTRLGVRVLAAGLVVALLPAFGLVWAWPATPALWLVLLVVAAIDALRMPPTRSVLWSLETPPRLHVGNREPCELEVRAPVRRPTALRCAVELSPDLEPQSPVEGRLLPGERTRLAWTLFPRRRGTVRVERLWIDVESPLGLWRRMRVFDVERELAVLPDLPLVRRTAIRFFDDREFRAGLKLERYRGDGTEFESLKEFAVGDDHRALDWKASARHRKLLTRQHRAERNHQIVVAVDTGHLMSEPVDGIPKLDHALNAALLLSYVGLASGDRVGLYTFGAKVGPSLAPVSGRSSMASLIELTGHVEYSTEETNFTLGLTTLAQRLRRRTLVILLTDFVDSITAELMLENVGRLVRRHLVVFVSMRDPLLRELTLRRPRNLEALDRAVVAQGFLDARELVHERLRHLGLRPLDVEPREVGPALVNRYLDAKRRGLIA